MRLRILYNSNFILMTTSWGINAIAITRVHWIYFVLTHYLISHFLWASYSSSYSCWWTGNRFTLQYPYLQESVCDGSRARFSGPWRCDHPSYFTGTSSYRTCEPRYSILCMIAHHENMPI